MGEQDNTHNFAAQGEISRRTPSLRHVWLTGTVHGDDGTCTPYTLTLNTTLPTPLAAPSPATLYITSSPPSTSSTLATAPAFSTTSTSLTRNTATSGGTRTQTRFCKGTITLSPTQPFSPGPSTTTLLTTPSASNTLPYATGSGRGADMRAGQV